jgi:hypothetical protein
MYLQKVAILRQYFKPSEGCDSTVNLALTVNPIKTTNITNVICSGESVTVGNDVFTESGNFHNRTSNHLKAVTVQ